jgi:peroxiredoxin
MGKHTLGKEKPQRRRWVRWLLELGAFIIIITGIRVWQHWGMVDGVAPDFKLTALNGGAVNLADYQGKPLVLHFWAEWCPMCEMEQGSITSLSEENQVVTVAFQSGSDENIQHYMEGKGISDWVTVNDADGKLAAQYGVHGVPTTYILDADGNIRFSEVGLTSGWGLRIRLWLTRLLGGEATD